MRFNLHIPTDYWYVFYTSSTDKRTSPFTMALLPEGKSPWRLYFFATIGKKGNSNVTYQFQQLTKTKYICHKQ